MTPAARTSRRARRGVAYILSLVLLCLFAGLSLALATSSWMNFRQGSNLCDAAQAQRAAESGMVFIVSTLRDLNLPGTTTSETFLDNLHAALGERLNGTANLGAASIERQASAVFVPDIPIESGSFCCWLSLAGADRCRLTVRGTSGELSRRQEMDLLLVQTRAGAFNYGLACRGPLSVAGSAKITGVNNPNEADVFAMTQTQGAAIAVDGTSVVISGDLCTSNGDGSVTISGSPSIGGSRDPEEVAKHIHTGTYPPDFPAIDVAPLAALATNIVDGSTDTSLPGLVLNNIRIKAGTNPIFAADVTINGIVYVEAPNVVRFEGRTDLNGMVVADGAGENIDACQISFGGHVEARDVETLPDTPEFAAIRQKTGTFVLAPGFGVTFTGSFSAINGSIAADRLTFTGTAEGNIKGSVIGLSDRTSQVSGNVTIYVDRQGADPNPAGFLPAFSFNPDPSSYVETTEEASSE